LDKAVFLEIGAVNVGAINDRHHRHGKTTGLGLLERHEEQGHLGLKIYNHASTASKAGASPTAAQEGAANGTVQSDMVMRMLGIVGKAETNAAIVTITREDTNVHKFGTSTTTITPTVTRNTDDMGHSLFTESGSTTTITITPTVTVTNESCSVCMHPVHSDLQPAVVSGQHVFVVDEHGHTSTVLNQ